MVEPLFTKEAVEKLRPRIQETVDRILQNMVELGPGNGVDLVERFALPVPSYVRTTAVDNSRNILMLWYRLSTVFWAYH